MYILDRISNHLLFHWRILITVSRELQIQELILLEIARLLIELDTSFLFK